MSHLSLQVQPGNSLISLVSLQVKVLSLHEVFDCPCTYIDHYNLPTTSIYFLAHLAALHESSTVIDSTWSKERNSLSKPSIAPN